MVGSQGGPKRGVPKGVTKAGPKGVPHKWWVPKGGLKCGPPNGGPPK
jgi:hypothetical protein